MLGKTEGKRRSGQQRMRWFHGIINSTDMNLSKLWEIVKDKEVWHGMLQSMAEKDLKSPSSTRLEAGFPYHDSRAMTRSPSPCAWTPDFTGAT